MIALDASALLVYMFREPGHQLVAGHIENSYLSAVNLAEVLGRFTRDGHDAARVLETLRATSIQIVPFGPDDAVRVAILLPLTRSLGLSLGDRACLALAQSRRVPALTADRDWLALEIGVDIRAVR